MEYPEFLKFQNVHLFVPCKSMSVFSIAQGTKQDTFGKNRSKLDTFGHFTIHLFGRMTKSFINQLLILRRDITRR